MLIKKLSEVEWTNSSHIGVQKKICFDSMETISNVTQVAYTELKRGEYVNIHTHNTMEEFFIILEGKLEFVINKEYLVAEKDSIIRIAPNTKHSLKANIDCKFYYWGGVNLNCKFNYVSK